MTLPEDVLLVDILSKLGRRPESASNLVKTYGCPAVMRARRPGLKQMAYWITEAAFATWLDKHEQRMYFARMLKRGKGAAEEEEPAHREATPRRCMKEVLADIWDDPVPGFDSRFLDVAR